MALHGQGHRVGTLRRKILPRLRAIGLTTVWHLFPILLLQVQALSIRSGSQSHENRYFTQHHELPPLEPVVGVNGTLHSNKIIMGPLPVVYTNDPRTVAMWISDHIPPTEPCSIGVDLELVPNAPWIKRRASFFGPAVVQMATPRHVLVVHLAKSSGRPSKACAPLFESLLSNPEVVKVGCGIDQDFLELRAKWKGMEARSRFDLGGVGGDFSYMVGLRTLCEKILSVDLPKSRRLATSDWSQVPLTNAQLAYCARDAWAGAAIAAELEALTPETFHPRALVRRFESQRSLCETMKRQRARKQAKNLLSSLRAPYSLSEQRFVPSHDFPDWKKTRIDELNQVLLENRYDDLHVFDPQELGRVYEMVKSNRTG